MEVARIGEFPAAARFIFSQNVLQRLCSQQRPECFKRPAAHVDPVAAEDSAQVVLAIARFILGKRMRAGAVETGEIGDEFRRPGKDPHSCLARGVHDALDPIEGDVLVVEGADGDEQSVKTLRPQAGEKRPGRFHIPEPRGVGFDVVDGDPGPARGREHCGQLLRPQQGLAAADVHRGAAARFHSAKIRFGGVGADVALFPMRAAVVEAVPAGGGAEIVRDDPARSEPSDFQLGKPHGKCVHWRFT